MYSVTRQSAADQLQISVRSVDRYIKSGKLRILKEGKNILIHSDDIQNMRNGGKSKHHVILNKKDSTLKNNFGKTIPSPPTETLSETQLRSSASSDPLTPIYQSLREEIEKKDELIQTLAIRVGKAEEIAKNSISINDFKKSQFLLEESKSAIHSELEATKKIKEKLSGELRYEKQVKILFFLLSVALFVILFFVWINNI